MMEMKTGEVDEDAIKLIRNNKMAISLNEEVQSLLQDVYQRDLKYATLFEEHCRFSRRFENLDIGYKLLLKQHKRLHEKFQEAQQPVAENTKNRRRNRGSSASKLGMSNKKVKWKDKEAENVQQDPEKWALTFEERTLLMEEIRTVQDEFRLADLQSKVRGKAFELLKAQEADNEKMIVDLQLRNVAMKKKMQTDYKAACRKFKEDVAVSLKAALRKQNTEDKEKLKSMEEAIQLQVKQFEPQMQVSEADLSSLRKSLTNEQSNDANAQSTPMMDRSTQHSILPEQVTRLNKEILRLRAALALMSKHSVYAKGQLQLKDLDTKELEAELTALKQEHEGYEDIVNNLKQEIAQQQTLNQTITTQPIELPKHQCTDVRCLAQTDRKQYLTNKIQQHEVDSHEHINVQQPIPVLLEEYQPDTKREELEQYVPPVQIVNQQPSLSSQSPGIHQDVRDEQYNIHEIDNDKITFHKDPEITDTGLNVRDAEHFKTEAAPIKYLMKTAGVAAYEKTPQNPPSTTTLNSQPFMGCADVEPKEETPDNMCVELNDRHNINPQSTYTIEIQRKVSFDLVDDSDDSDDDDEYYEVSEPVIVNPNAGEPVHNIAHDHLRLNTCLSQNDTSSNTEETNISFEAGIHEVGKEKEKDSLNQILNEVTSGKDNQHPLIQSMCTAVPDVPTHETDKAHKTHSALVVLNEDEPYIINQSSAAYNSMVSNDILSSESTEVHNEFKSVECISHVSATETRDQQESILQKRVAELEKEMKALQYKNDCLVNENKLLTEEQIYLERNDQHWSNKEETTIVDHGTNEKLSDPNVNVNINLLKRCNDLEAQLQDLLAVTPNINQLPTISENMKLENQDVESTHDNLEHSSLADCLETHNQYDRTNPQITMNSLNPYKTGQVNSQELEKDYSTRMESSNMDVESNGSINIMNSANSSANTTNGSSSNILDVDSTSADLVESFDNNDKTFVQETVITNDNDCTFASDRVHGVESTSNTMSTSHVLKSNNLQEQIAVLQRELVALHKEKETLANENKQLRDCNILNISRKSIDTSRDTMSQVTIENVMPVGHLDHLEESGFVDDQSVASSGYEREYRNNGGMWAMKTLQQKSDILTKQLTDSQEQCFNLKMEIESIVESNKTMQFELDAAEERLSLLETEIERLTIEKDKTEDSKQQIKKANQSLMSRVEDLEDENANLQSDLEYAKNSVTDTSAQSEKRLLSDKCETLEKTVYTLQTEVQRLIDEKELIAIENIQLKDDLSLTNLRQKTMTKSLHRELVYDASDRNEPNGEDIKGEETRVKEISVRAKEVWVTKQGRSSSSECKQDHEKLEQANQELTKKIKKVMKVNQVLNHDNTNLQQQIKNLMVRVFENEFEELAKMEYSPAPSDIDQESQVSSLSKASISQLLQLPGISVSSSEIEPIQISTPRSDILKSASQSSIHLVDLNEDILDNCVPADQLITMPFVSFDEDKNQSPLDSSTVDKKTSVSHTLALQEKDIKPNISRSNESPTPEEGILQTYTASQDPTSNSLISLNYHAEESWSGSEASNQQISRTNSSLDGSFNSNISLHEKLRSLLEENSQLKFRLHGIEQHMLHEFDATLQKMRDSGSERLNVKGEDVGDGISKYEHKFVFEHTVQSAEDEMNALEQKCEALQKQLMESEDKCSNLRDEVRMIEAGRTTSPLSLQHPDETEMIVLRQNNEELMKRLMESDARYSILNEEVKMSLGEQESYCKEMEDKQKKLQMRCTELEEQLKQSEEKCSLLKTHLRKIETEDNKYVDDNNDKLHVELDISKEEQSVLDTEIKKVIRDEATDIANNVQLKEGNKWLNTRDEISEGELTILHEQMNFETSKKALEQRSSEIHDIEIAHELEELKHKHAELISSFDKIMLDYTILEEKLEENMSEAKNLNNKNQVPSLVKQAKPNVTLQSNKQQNKSFPEKLSLETQLEILMQHNVELEEKCSEMAEELDKAHMKCDDLELALSGGNFENASIIQRPQLNTICPVVVHHTEAIEHKASESHNANNNSDPTYLLESRGIEKDGRSFVAKQADSGHIITPITIATTDQYAQTMPYNIEGETAKDQSVIDTHNPHEQFVTPVPQVIQLEDKITNSDIVVQYPQSETVDNTLNDDIITLKRFNDELNYRIEQQQSLIQDYYEVELTKVKEDVMEKEALISQSVERVNKLQTCLDKSQSQLVVVLDEIDELKNEMAHQKVKINDISTENNDLLKLKETLSEQLKQITQENGDKMEKINKLEEKIALMNKTHTSDKQKYESEIARLHLKEGDHDKECFHLQKILSETKIKFNTDVQAIRAEYEKTIAQLRSTAIKDNRIDLFNEHECQEAFEERYTNMEDIIQDLENQHLRDVSENEKLLAENASVILNLQNLAEENTILLQKIGKIERSEENSLGVESCQQCYALQEYKREAKELRDAMAQQNRSCMYNVDVNKDLEEFSALRSKTDLWRDNGKLRQEVQLLNQQICALVKENIVLKQSEETFVNEEVVIESLVGENESVDTDSVRSGVLYSSIAASIDSGMFGDDLDRKNMSFDSVSSMGHSTATLANKSASNDVIMELRTRNEVLLREIERIGEARKRENEIQHKEKVLYDSWMDDLRRQLSNLRAEQAKRRELENYIAFMTKAHGYELEKMVETFRIEEAQKLEEFHSQIDALQGRAADLAKENETLKWRLSQNNQFAVLRKHLADTELLSFLNQLCSHLHCNILPIDSFECTDDVIPLLIPGMEVKPEECGDAECGNFIAVVFHKTSSHESQGFSQDDNVVDVVCTEQGVLADCPANRAAFQKLEHVLQRGKEHCA